MAQDGRSADFYRIQKIDGDWYRFDLGRVEGEAPFSTVLAGYRRFTPFDAELMQQSCDYIANSAAKIELECSLVAAKLSAAVDSFTA